MTPYARALLRLSRWLLAAGLALCAGCLLTGRAQRRRGRVKRQV